MLESTLLKGDLHRDLNKYYGFILFPIRKFTCKNTTKKVKSGFSQQITLHLARYYSWSQVKVVKPHSSTLANK